MKKVGKDNEIWLIKGGREGKSSRKKGESKGTLGRLRKGIPERKKRKLEQENKQEH